MGTTTITNINKNSSIWNIEEVKNVINNKKLLLL